MFNFEPITTTNIFSIIQILVVVAGFYWSWKSLNAMQANVKVAADHLEATKASVKLAADHLQAAKENLKTAADSVSVANATLQHGIQNTQAQLFSDMSVQGRDLQFKFMELFHASDSPEDLNSNRDQYLGTLIGYYASCFEVRQVIKLSDNAIKLFDADLEALMEQKIVREKWNEIRGMYSIEFGKYVDNLRGVK
ncbi:hypothetical protein BZM27_09340 [Paraburkholderia steynii]|uniref:Chemotaxis protein n=1 Tax=Paraburkholderia steynii TaxID=1245441 RepID=A0A4R0XEX6_9BURK|nr:hypothetical protein BZM27_09340 [Paraburkholderia steynii]